MLSQSGIYLFLTSVRAVLHAAIALFFTQFHLIDLLRQPLTLSTSTNSLSLRISDGPSLICRRRSMIEAKQIITQVLTTIGHFGGLLASISAGNQ